MDTDGWDHGSQLSTASNQLALDVVQLVRSLGGTARLSSKETFYVYRGQRCQGKTAYMVTMKMPFTPFALERKKLVYENHRRTPPCRKVVAIEDGGTAECVCISVDAPDSLYVTNDYVVTHNTYIMVWFVSDLKQRTLFLTHTDQLAEQFITRFRYGSPRSDGKDGFIPVTNCLQLEKELGTEIIGRYRGPDKLWPVTVATWQSFISPGGRKAMKALKESFGLVLCDEAHVFAAPAAASVVNGFAAKQKRGVTATPKRKDQLDIALYDVLGQVTAEGKSDQLPVAAYMISTGVTYKGRSFPGMGDWARILNFLYAHAERNDFIEKWLIHDAKQGRKILVLGERRRWLLDLAEKLKKEHGINAKAVVGGVQGARREQIIQEMTTGDLQVLLCTTKIGREGLDIPVLDTLYATMPLANKSGLEQMLGRERRPHPAKKPPVIFRYFVDEGHGQLFGCAKATHRHLVDEGAEIHLIEVGRDPAKVMLGAQVEAAQDDGMLDPVPRRSGLKAAAARAPSAVKKLFIDLKEEARLSKQYNDRMGNKS
jgi:superfamily II DNA or RNA helicase